MRFRLLAAAALVAAALPGCGDVPRSRVHGTVKYQGKPLAGATIILVASDNRTHPAVLKPDGSFDVSGVARGPVKVSVQPALPRVAPRPDPAPGGQAKGGEEKDARRPAGPPPGGADKDAGPRLPATYTDPDKSGLLFDLKDPDQEWSVDLK